MILKKPNSNPISVVIPYHKNQKGLVYSLTTLQTQIKKPDQIILIDTSLDKSGLEIAKQFTYNEIPIYIEVLPSATIYTAWNRGMQLALEKIPNTHVLVINDDLLIPQSIISTLSYVVGQNKGLAYVPETVDRTHVSKYNGTLFKAFSDGVITPEITKWLVGFCFLLTNNCIKTIGLFDDKKYTIWFGDTDYERRILEKGEIYKIKGLNVYHFGGMSHKYADSKTQAIIAKDRAAFTGEVKDLFVPKVGFTDPVEAFPAIKKFKCKKCGAEFEKVIEVATHTRLNHKKK